MLALVSCLMVVAGECTWAGTKSDKQGKTEWFTSEVEGMTVRTPYKMEPIPNLTQMRVRRAMDKLMVMRNPDLSEPILGGLSYFEFDPEVLAAEDEQSVIEATVAGIASGVQRDVGTYKTRKITTDGVEGWDVSGTLEPSIGAEIRFRLRMYKLGGRMWTVHMCGKTDRDIDGVAEKMAQSITFKNLER